MPHDEPRTNPRAPWHVRAGTRGHNALHGIADAATKASLYPLAVMLAAAAVLILRTKMLPRWLGLGAGAAAVALAVDGGPIYVNAGPGLVLFLVWTLVARIVLLRRTWRQLASTGRGGRSDPSRGGIGISPRGAPRWRAPARTLG